MKRIISAAVVCLLLAAAVTAAVCEKGQIGQAAQVDGFTSVITQPKMGDSKIMKDKVIAGTDGHMIIYNFDSSVFREYSDVPLRWLYVYEPEDLVVAGNDLYTVKCMRSKDCVHWQDAPEGEG